MRSLTKHHDFTTTMFQPLSFDIHDKTYLKTSRVAKLDKKAAEFITNYTQLEYFSYLVFNNDDSELLSSKLLALNVFFFRLS